MNFKDMIVPFILAVATTWAVQYFFFGKKETPAQYQFSAPQSAVECVPLQKEVGFVFPSKPVAPTITAVETKWANLEFTTHGAALNRLEFKRNGDSDSRSISTIFPPEQDKKANRAFLVALSDDTPFVYKLRDKQETDTAIVLSYGAASEAAAIYKTFTVYKDIHQVDLKISVEPQQQKKQNIRLFYPAPIMPALKDQEQVAADIMYGADTFKKIYRDSIPLDTYWVQPILFGVENKYFTHTLVADTHGFAQRAYYKLADKDNLFAILEGPPIDTQKSWTMSFYLGPKESSAMHQVDERLDQILDYSGIWAPISRVLLTVLNKINDYVHNYGIAIIVLTFLIKILLLPFSLRSERGLKGRTQMQKQLQYIQQKYKDDPQGKTQAQAEFMRKHGLGLAGCLPMFLQIPIFFGLSRVLSSAIELYKSPFLWMNDLSARDPYYILPFIVMIGMLASAFTVTDTKQRMPIIAMSFAFGAISSSMSAGLVLYIALSTVLNVAQNKLFKLFRLV